MFASLLTDFTAWSYLLTSPVWLVMTAFQIWMFVHAIRNREWIWALFIFIGWGLSAIFYYFMVYRASPSVDERIRTARRAQTQTHQGTSGANPSSRQGASSFATRRHLFSAGQTGQGRSTPTARRWNATRKDIDTRAHLGQCLLRQKRAAEARPLLEGVVAENPKHDYGYTLMALAETLTALGETDSALKIWQHVTAEHSYARAKVQLAELYLAKNQPELALAEAQGCGK